MAFASAFFLWLLPLAALPVIFHLLMKRRQRRLAFPALLFFLQADPRLHARRRLRELLLLVARVLLLLLVLLALARPILRHVPAAGGRIALAIVVDNSASMDGPTPDGPSRLELAREAARRLLDSLDAGGSAMIVPLVADPSLDTPVALTADRDALNRQLARIRRTEAQGATAGAFARVRTALSQAPAGMRRAVHIFTDLHAAAWAGVEGGPRPFDQTEVVIHRIPGARRQAANIAIDAIDASHRILLPGHTATLDIGLRNTSDLPGDVRVNIHDNQGGLFSRRYAIGPGGVERIRYAFTPDAPGDHWVMVELEGDAFRGDNRAGLAFFCRERAAVWFMGERASYGLMPMAVSPSGTGRHTALVPVFKDPEVLFAETPGEADEAPALIVGTWGHVARLPASQTEALRDTIAAGGHLLVVPDSRAPIGEPAAPAPDWLGARPGPVDSRTEDTAMAGRILNPDAAIWDGLQAAIDAGRLRFFLLHRFAELETGPAYRLLAGITPRRPVLAERDMGEGRITVSGITWDPRWTSLATDPSGLAVVMLHNLARGGLRAGAGPDLLDVIAGDPLPVPFAPAAPPTIRALAGDTLDTAFVAPPLLARAGVYRLELDGRVWLVSVRGAAGEAAGTIADAERLAVMGTMPHHVVTLDSGGEDIARHLHAHFTGRPLFLPLALLALLVWAAEAWLATVHARFKRSPR